VLVLSRVDSLFDQHPRNSRIVDLLLLSYGAGMAAAITCSLWIAPKLLSPEVVYARALAEIDAGWLTSVAVMRQDQRSRADGTVSALARLMMRAIERGNSLLARQMISELSRKLRLLASRSEAVELDRCLAEQLGSVTYAATRLGAAGVLSELVVFGGSLPAPLSETWQHQIDPWATPPGEMFLRATLEACLAERVWSAAVLGIDEVVQKGRTRLHDLPELDAGQGMMMGPVHDGRANLPVAGHRVLLGFVRHYLRYPARLLETMSSGQSSEFANHAEANSRQMLFAIATEVEAASFRRVLLPATVDAIRRIRARTGDYVTSAEWEGVIQLVATEAPARATELAEVLRQAVPPSPAESRVRQSDRASALGGSTGLNLGKPLLGTLAACGDALQHVMRTWFRAN
jgi:hypothetical protein